MTEMHPILWHSENFILPAWHTFYVIGAVFTFIILRLLASRYERSIDLTDISRLFAVSYVSGYFGARLLSILVEEPEVQGVTATLAALGQFGAMTFYGGALGAFLGGATYARVRNLPLKPLLDLAIPAGLAGLAIGRIGCFLNGDDYGKPAPLGANGQPPVWAVTFPNLADGVARWPVQLFEASLVTILVAILIAKFTEIRRSFGAGAVAFSAVVTYANLRFGLEFLRDDFRGSVAGTWLSTSQFISICILAVCGATIPFWLKARP